MARAKVVEQVAAPAKVVELEKATFRLPAHHLEALRTEASKRAGQRGTAKPDVSEVVREAVAEWLRKRSR